jgi:hypothetical protein
MDQYKPLLIYVENNANMSFILEIFTIHSITSAKRGGV